MRRQRDRSGHLADNRLVRRARSARGGPDLSRQRRPGQSPRAYAHQSKNRQLEIDAAEIRIRAERRLGELLIEQKAIVGLNTGAAAGGEKEGPRGNYTEPRDARPTLSDIGVDKKLSSHAQKVAAIPAAGALILPKAWHQRIPFAGKVPNSPR